MEFFNKGDLKIYHDSIIDIQDIPENSIDLIVTSPPYCLNISYDTYKDDMPYEDYLKWSSQWLSKVYDLSKSDGRFCLNVPMQTSKGEIRKIGVDLINIATKLGWQYKTTIIWDKIVCPKTQSRGTIMDPFNARLVDNYEIIVVFYKDTWQKATRKDESDLSRKEYLDGSEGIWRFQGRSDPDHPVPFPLLLPWKCLKQFSYIGDTVLEPFLGTGTTLIAASMLNRKGIGTDISEKYCTLARDNILSCTKEGKRKMCEEAGIEYDETRDGVPNTELIAKLSQERKERTVRTHSVMKFLK